LSVSYKDVKDWDKAIHYQEQSILHAKLMKDGEKKIKKVYDYLSRLANLYHHMGKLTEAKTVREEAYMYVNATYDPEHPLVLEAGGYLIEILNETGNYYDAERFARVCYEALTRAPLDPDSFEAANAASNLADASRNLINENGPLSADIKEAEILARKAVRIVRELKGPFSFEMRNAFRSLVNVIFLKGDFTNETKSVLEDFLSDAIRHEGVDGKSTGCGNGHLGLFYFNLAVTISVDNTKRRHLLIAQSYYKETSRIFTKHYGPNHINTLHITSKLSDVSMELEQIGNHHSSEEL
jgi:tetratricopeptide (TPR) repeat protein